MTPPDSGEREVMSGYVSVECVVRGEVAVHVPLGLVQRILAALETNDGWTWRHHVAAELRAAMPGAGEGER